MADKKVISIRFHVDNKEDMKLYRRLELEAGNSASLASVVKSKIRDSYNRQDIIEQNASLNDRLVAVVREEIQESSMKLVGAIVSGMNSNGTTIIPITDSDDNKLPDKSVELPEGALDFLE